MIPEELDKLIDTLIYVSGVDGVLSKEEHSIIEVVKSNVQEFKKAYQDAWKDNKLSEDDKSHLQNLWKNIMIETTKTAIKDNKYTKEELSLVFRIFSTIIKGMEPEEHRG